MTFEASQIITAGDMSQASITSTVIDLNQIYAWMIQAIYTGTPTGTLLVQVSCDNVKSSSLVTNWSTFPSSSTALSGSAGDKVWNDVGAAYRWLRLTYTKASGTGTLNATFNAKG